MGVIPPDLTLRGGLDPVHRLMLNLVSNACKSTISAHLNGTAHPEHRDWY